VLSVSLPSVGEVQTVELSMDDKDSLYKFNLKLVILPVN
tara:strand:+ start:527 stop:643 length:117 start_codon:yes stop_codon:yes gene_type:complete